MKCEPYFTVILVSLSLGTLKRSKCVYEVYFMYVLCFPQSVYGVSCNKGCMS